MTRALTNASRLASTAGALSFAAQVVAFGGCGSGDDKPSHLGAISAPSYCDGYATTYCAKQKQCLPFLWTANYVSDADCVDHVRQTCGALVSAHGSGYGEAWFAACSGALRAAACDGSLFGGLEGCYPPQGKLADGAACWNGGQCQGRVCDSFDAVCGTCATPVPAGATCTNSYQCAPEQTCTGALCQPITLLGDACDFTHPCYGVDFGLVRCANGVCVAGLALGDSCVTAGDGTCDFYGAGLYCGASGTCEALTVAAYGAKCEQTKTLCSGGSCRADGKCGKSESTQLWEYCAS